VEFERAFSVDQDPELLRERLETFFESAGYEPEDSQASLVYKRGSRLGSFVSFSPRGWQVTATLQMEPASVDSTDVGVTFAVNTSEQWLTEKERAFWESELASLEAAVQTGAIDVDAIAGTDRPAMWQNLVAGVLILALAVGLAVVVRLLTHSRILFYAAGAFGLWLGYKIAQRWLKF
jgi:hypothetical protein